MRCIRAYYYACISFIDFQVGRLLKALEETGRLEDTLILFTSDHGELLGDFNCFGKRSMHAAAARVPLIARLPGRFSGGAACARPVSLVDIAPTILAVSGASLTSHPLDGVDLEEIASGRSRRPVVFSQFAEGPTSAGARAAHSTCMATTERWKYFYSAPDDREFLFDRVQDLSETRNRAGLPHCREALRDMKALLIGHLRAGGETAGLEGDDWRRFPRLSVPEDPDAGLLIQDQKWADLRIPGYSD